VEWSEERFPLRSAADDVESFAWLWLWTLLAIGRKKDDLDKIEQDWIDSLECVTTHLKARKDKENIMARLTYKPNLEDFPQRKDEYSLFLKWLDICRSHQAFLDVRNQDAENLKTSTMIDEEYDGLYAKFIAEGIKYIKAHKD
jgi:hypothetical protein